MRVATKTSVCGGDVLVILSMTPGEPVRRVGQVAVLADVVGADVQQHGPRLVGAHPADDVGVDLVDPPSPPVPPLVVVVPEAGRPVEGRPDEVRGVAALRQALPEPDAVAAA